MRSIIAILLALTIVFGFSACSKEETDSDKDTSAQTSTIETTSKEGVDTDIVESDATISDDNTKSFDNNSTITNPTTSTIESTETTPTHIHSYSSNIVNPTCTNEGYTEYHCFCGDTYKDTRISAIGHTEVIDPAIPASKFAPGQSEGKHCSVCGEVLVARKTVSKTEDSAGNSTFKFLNSLDEEYEYKLGSTLYSKCKIEYFFCRISNSGNGNVELYINFDVVKTAEGETQNKDILFYFFLFCDGEQIDGAMIYKPDTELGATYHMRYDRGFLPEGNYTLMFRSAYSL